MCNLKDKVMAGCGRNASSSMSATGIPPTLVLATQMEHLSEEVGNLRETFNCQRLEILQCVGDQFKEMPEKLSTHLRSSMEINGMIQVTHSDLDRITHGLESRLLAAMRIMGTGSQIATVAAAPATVVEDDGASFTAHWRLYKWSNGSLDQYFPEDFKLAICTVSALWDLWYIGKTGIRQAPYRKIVAKKHIHSKNQITYFSKAKKVISSVESAALKLGLISTPKKLVEMPYQEFRAIYNQAFLLVAKEFYNLPMDELADKMRLGDVSFLTFYDVILKSKKRGIDEVDDSSVH